MIRLVVFARDAEKDLRAIPRHVALKLMAWVEDVKHLGLEEVRKVSGFHDEPLKGALKGFRSIRLSGAYRAYYRIVRDQAEFVRIERVDKHEY